MLTGSAIVRDSNKTSLADSLRRWSHQECSVARAPPLDTRTAPGSVEGYLVDSITW